MRRFKKKVLNADIINQYKTHQEFTPKSVAKQARKANKLRKSREQNE
jgi:ribosomal protein S21